MNDPISKETIRHEARARRRRLANREAFGRAIQQELIDSDEFRAARRVLLYAHMPDEVSTDNAILAALKQGKETFVPYCDGEVLQLFHLLNWNELEPGAFDILEPKDELRSIDERHRPVEQMDLVVVPGVAFDRDWNRVGQGAGYYDRLFEPIAKRPLGERPTLIGLAFECQVFDAVPHGPHDVKMDRVIVG